MARNWLDLDDDWQLGVLRRERRDPWRSLDRLQDDLFADFTAKAASLRRRLGRRDSSRYPDRVSLPSSSSNVSNVSNTSDNSDPSEDASVCTERSSTRSEVSEQLPGGREQHKVEEAEKWVSRDDGGRVRGEGTASDTLTTERRPGSVQEIRKQESSYLERSGDSISSNSTISENYSSVKTSENISSNIKSSTENVSAAVKQTTRQAGKPFRVPPNRSAFYDELDSSLLSHTRTRPRSRAFDAVARLVDEVMDHDRLFQNDIDDFITRRHSGLFSRTENEGSPRRKTAVDDLQRELEALQQENARLQTALQEVTAVNKRWQRYNNERRGYVQKLLATIQEQQDQLDKVKHTADDALREKCAALELQAKSHKEDWDRERREKRKAEEEKGGLEEEVKELQKEVQLLTGALEEERSKRSECSCPRPASQVTSQDFAFCTQVQVPYNPAEEQSPSPCQSRCSARSSPRSVYLGFPDQGFATVRAFSAEPRPHHYNIPARTPPETQNLVDISSQEPPSGPEQPSQGDPSIQAMHHPNVPYLNARLTPEHLSEQYQHGPPPPHFLPPPYYPNMPVPRFHHPYYDYPGPGARPRPDPAMEPVLCPNCGRAFSPALRPCFQDHVEFCKNTDASNTYPS